MILIGNNILFLIIFISAKVENCYNLTSKKVSLATKISFLLFLNTAIIPNVVFFIFDCKNKLDRNCFASFYFIVFIGFALSLNFFKLFNPIYLYRIFKRKKEISLGIKSKLLQFQANALFEGYLNISNFKFFLMIKKLFL